MTSLHDLTARTPGLPCRLDPDLWYADTARDRDAAVRACRDCPLRQACAEYAVSEREPYGVWGGTTAADRRSFGDGRPWRFDEQGRLRQLCGSESAYRAHHAYRETPGVDCVGGDCVAAHDAVVEADRRARLDAEHARGGSPRGWWIHRSLGERSCEPCRRAQLAQQAVNRQARARRGSQRARSGSGPSGASGVLRGREGGAQPFLIAS